MGTGREVKTDSGIAKIMGRISMNFDIKKMQWIRAPMRYVIGNERIEITTEPGTDLWQRTYYHFRNDNAPILQMETEEKFFSFVVKADFTGAHHRFDQCGIVMYLDNEKTGRFYSIRGNSVLQWVQAVK